MDGVSEGLVADLREARARCEAAQEDVTALKVMLATRTHQHDLAWQDAQRLAAELEAERARAAAAAARARDAEADLAAARERLAAADAVLGAVGPCLRWRGLDRRRFRDLIDAAGRAAPTEGPGAARHAGLLDGARRVLGIRA